jgi:hypothetical protein
MAGAGDWCEMHPTKTRLPQKHIAARVGSAQGQHRMCSVVFEAKKRVFAARNST